MRKNPYSEYFVLTNSDPYNYVLYKDFFYYIIISIYLFVIWYFVTVFKNYDAMKITNLGQSAWWLAVVSASGFFLAILSILSNKDRYPYSLTGLAFIVLLISMATVVYNFDKDEIAKGFENDPTQIAYAFLISYSFVSYFVCS